MARPPGGFRVTVVDSVKEYVAAETRDNFRIPQLWDDLLDRIKDTALREGTPFGDEPLTFTFIADGAPDFQIPTIQIVYSILGDELTITSALIWNESDHDDDETDDSNSA